MSFGEWAGDRRFKSLTLIILVLAAIALGAYSYLTIKQSKYVYSGPNTISVSGKGEIFAKPDIATFSFSVRAEAKDPSDAQAQSGEAINKIFAFLKEKGIEEKDIKTLGYDLSPKYNWEQEICTQWNCPPGKQTLEGYTVNQTIEVKVRDTAKAGELIAGIGGLGATDVSGLAFKIDDDEKLKSEARALAIADAKENAKKLADDLDVRLVRFMNYWEDQSPVYPMYSGMGGAYDEASLKSFAPPELPMGENTITSNVTLVYEIR